MIEGQIPQGDNGEAFIRLIQPETRPVSAVVAASAIEAYSTGEMSAEELADFRERYKAAHTVED